MTYPNRTPKSYLTLSAGPEDRLADSEALTEPIEAFPARRLAALRAERDPLTPELLSEKIARRLERYVAPIPESELRALWGDR